MSTGPPLLIVGASGRASAFSALHAGFSPVVLDMFADADLAAVATVHPCDPANFVSAVIETADTIPPMPWLYCGGLENHPDLVARISARHSLCGISPNPLRRVRDPITLSRSLLSYGVATPRTVLPGSPITSEGCWIVKPIPSAGGIGVRMLSEGETFEDGPFVIQEFLPGQTVGALYLAGETECETIGICDQFPPKNGFPGSFVYQGSLGPFPLSEELAAQIDRAGKILQGEFGLQGLFGADFILFEERATLIEVNPRPTASVEILEYATGRRLLAEHLACFGLKTEATPGPPGGYAAKRILYAQENLKVPEDWVWRLQPPTPGRMPTAADLPVSGSRISRGEPILTLISTGKGLTECTDRLAQLQIEFESVCADWSIL